MKIFVKAKARSRIEKVVQLEATHFLISVKEPAKEGKANGAILKVLARHLGISKSNIRLIKGETFKEKVFQIDA